MSTGLTIFSWDLHVPKFFFFKFTKMFRKVFWTGHIHVTTSILVIWMYILLIRIEVKYLVIHCIWHEQTFVKSKKVAYNESCDNMSNSKKTDIFISIRRMIHVHYRYMNMSRSINSDLLQNLSASTLFWSQFL